MDLYFLTCAGVLCYYDVRIVCLVILTALLPVAVPFLIGEKLSQKTKALYEELENYNRKLKDWMGGFEVIHSFQVEDEVKKTVCEKVWKMWRNGVMREGNIRIHTEY